jgi:hypothetical protein
MQQHRLNFKSIWLETILTGDVFDKEDIIALLERFQIRFSGKEWQRKIPAEEMGNVLITDIPSNKLTSAVNNLLLNKYPDKLSFNEAEKIYLKFRNYDLASLAKIYVSLSRNQKLKEVVGEYILQNRHPDEFNKGDIWRFLLIELYGVEKSKDQGKAALR